MNVFFAELGAPKVPTDYPGVSWGPKRQRLVETTVLSEEDGPVRNHLCDEIKAAGDLGRAASRSSGCAEEFVAQAYVIKIGGLKVEGSAATDGRREALELLERDKDPVCSQSLERALQSLSSPTILLASRSGGFRKGS